MHKIKSINEFVIKFANVNGSGSTSANEMFAKGFFRLGVPVSPKNIFPSKTFKKSLFSNILNPCYTCINREMNYFL